MCADFHRNNFAEKALFLQKTLDIKIFFRTKEPGTISFSGPFF